MTGNAQIVGELGKPFVLEGLFGEADAMMDDEHELGTSAEDATMDVEDGGMQIDDDASPYVLAHLSNVTLITPPCRPNPRKRAHSPVDDEDAGSGPAFRAPKRLRKLAVRTASLPSASMAVRSRRAERLARRKRERAAVQHDRARMELDDGSQQQQHLQ
jgi:nuclear GTP-binding protein